MSKECKEELVSIIIPVYNTPKQFLEECLESIRKQRYKNIEVIIPLSGICSEISGESRSGRLDRPCGYDRFLSERKKYRHST